MSKKMVRSLLCCAMYVGAGLAAVAALSACAGPPPPPALACTKTWTGPTDGLFSEAGFWSPAGSPAGTDVICSAPGTSIVIDTPATVDGAELQGATSIGSTGTLTVTNAATVSTVHDITLSGGSLAGAAPVWLSGTARWTSGAITGPGARVVPPASVLEVNGTTTRSLGTELDIDGTMHLGDATVTMTGGSSIWNRGLTTFTGEAVTITAQPIFGTPVPQIHNEATGTMVSFMTSTDEEVVAEASLFPAIQNLGLVTVQQGRFSLQGGALTGTPHTGRFVTATAADLRLFANTPFGAGSILDNAGTTHFIGTIDVVAGVSINNTGLIEMSGFVNWPSVVPVSGTVHMTGGRLMGNPTITGSFTWDEGTLAGGTTTVAPSGSMTVTDIGITTLDPNQVLHNLGTLTFEHFRYNLGPVQQAAHQTAMGDGSMVDNDATMVVIAYSGNPFIMASLNENIGSRLRNGPAGTLTVRRPTSCPFPIVPPETECAPPVAIVDFDRTIFNSGTIDVLDGTVAMTTYSTGPLVVHDQADVKLTGQQQPGSTVVNDGLVRIAGVDWQTSAPLPGHVILQTDKWGDGIGGDVTITGTFDWLEHSPIGSAEFAPGSVVKTVRYNSGVCCASKIYGHIRNYSTFNVTTALGFEGGSRFTNHGRVNVRPGGDLSWTQSQTEEHFVNDVDGTIYVTAPGNVGIGPIFENAGTLIVGATSTTLVIGGNNAVGAADTGSIAIGAGSVVSVNSSLPRTFGPGSVVSGAGTLMCSYGEVNFVGATVSSAVELYDGSIVGDVTFTGAVKWRSGTFGGAGQTTTIAAGGSLSMDAASHGSPTLTDHEIHNYGTMTLLPNMNNGLWIYGNASIHNFGTLDVSPTFDWPFMGAPGTSLVNESTGTMTVAMTATTTKVILGVPFTNHGNLSMNGQLDLSAGFTNISAGTLSGGSYDLSGKILVANATTPITTLDASVRLGQSSGIVGVDLVDRLLLTSVTSNGVLTVDRSLNLSALGPLVTNGSITVDAYCTLTVSALTQAAGSLTLASPASALVSSGSISITGGVLNSSGHITGPLDVQAGGTLSPGTPHGAYTHTGTAGLAGTNAVQIGGTTPGTQYDRTNVSGAVVVGGTLALSLSDGFVPTVGDTFRFLTAGSVSGTFSTVTGTALPGGTTHFVVIYGPTVVSVRVVAGP